MKMPIGNCSSFVAQLRLVVVLDVIVLAVEEVEYVDECLEVPVEPVPDPCARQGEGTRGDAAVFDERPRTEVAQRQRAAPGADVTHGERQ